MNAANIVTLTSEPPRPYVSSRRDPGRTLFLQGRVSARRIASGSSPGGLTGGVRDRGMGSLNATPMSDQSLSPATKPSACLAGCRAIGSREGWQERSQGRWRWRIHPDWLPFFEADDRPNWLELTGDPRARLVKANDGREVWAVQAGRDVLFAKVGRPGRQWARWRRLLFGSDAARERRIAEYAADHQIETVCPVAVADAPIEGRKPTSIFVTIGLEGAEPLNERWSRLDLTDPTTRKIKNQIIDVAARLVAHAHQNGFEHFDLHAGNVLIQPHGNRYRALFVDLHNVRTGRCVNNAAVIRNLAQFNQWFRRHALLTDRLRFLDTYLHWRKVLQPKSAYGRNLRCNKRELLDRLARAARKHANTLYAKRDRRIMRTGRYFAGLKLDQGWWAHVFLTSKHAVPGSRASQMLFEPRQWKHWLRDPTRWVSLADRSRIIKDSQSATVCRAELELPGGDTLPIVVKRSLGRSFFKRVRNIFGTSRPQLTWRRANGLLNRQIPTARPLAVVERRRFGLRLDSMVITEYLENAKDLDTVLTVSLRELSPHEQRRLKGEIIESLARVLRRLHERGFSHRDLKAPNVMVQWDPGSGDAPRVLLIDLDGLRATRRASFKRQLRAITRLNVSLDHCKRVTLTDRLRFLRRYLQRAGRPDPQWKPVWRAIAARSESKRWVRARYQKKMLEKYGRC